MCQSESASVVVTDWHRWSVTGETVIVPIVRGLIVREHLARRETGDRLTGIARSYNVHHNTIRIWPVFSNFHRSYFLK